MPREVMECRSCLAVRNPHTGEWVFAGASAKIQMRNQGIVFKDDTCPECKKAEGINEAKAMRISGQG